MLTTANTDEFGSPCENSSSLILFLSDGYPGVGIMTVDGIINLISGLNTLGTKVFTYGMGSIVSQSILKSIACANEGIMFVADGSTNST